MEATMPKPKSCLLPEHIERITARDGAPHSITEFDWRTTALVVVDMQNFYIAEGAPSYCADARAIVPNVNRLADAVRRFGSPVIWLRNVTNNEAFKGWSVHYERMKPDRVETRRRELAKDSDGVRLWHELDVRDDDLKLDKIRYSALIPGASNLEKVLGENGVDTIIICGVATNVCVESTARDAMMMNYRTLVVEDACAASDRALHEATLNSFYLYFGDVQTADDVIAHLGVDADIEAAE
jgi:ureidoacrylate peracid hydrolase